MGAWPSRVGWRHQWRKYRSIRCVDAANGGFADGDNIQLWSCNASRAQTFRITEAGGGDRFAVELDPSTNPESPGASRAFLRKVTGRLPGALNRQAAKETADAAPPRETPPGYFDVLATSLNIMQDHITRTRLAGEPPHVMLVPRLRNIGLMEFNRAHEAIDEGRACVEQALPTLKRYL